MVPDPRETAHAAQSDYFVRSSLVREVNCARIFCDTDPSSFRKLSETALTKDDKGRKIIRTDFGEKGEICQLKNLEAEKHKLEIAGGEEYARLEQEREIAREESSTGRNACGVRNGLIRASRNDVPRGSQAAGTTAWNGRNALKALAPFIVGTVQPAFLRSAAVAA